MDTLELLVARVNQMDDKFEYMPVAHIRDNVIWEKNCAIANTLINTIDDIAEYFPN